MASQAGATDRPSVTHVGQHFPKMAFSQSRLWLLVIIAAALLAGLSIWTHVSASGSLRKSLAGYLQAILKADVAALRSWLDNEKADVRAWAARAQVRENVQTLIRIASDSPTPAKPLQSSSALAALRKDLKSIELNKDIRGFVVIAHDGTVLASDRDRIIGLQLSPDDLANLDSVFGGASQIAPPFRRSALVSAYGPWPLEPMMAAAAPIITGPRPRSLIDSLLGPEEGDRVVATLVFLLDPKKDFTRILSIAHMGQTGHTYAFNRDGMMLSDSRFNDELKRIGLIADRPDATSILTVHVRDPGMDITGGDRPKEPLSARPLTQMAASAIAGESGVNAAGYRDYRGLKVMGAWEWLEEYDFGVATEVSESEVSNALRPIWVTFALLVAFLAVAGALLVVKTWINVRLRQRIDQVRQLGQYTLIEKIGQGGMGEVYRAQHTMLRRPTALKLLRGPSVTPETVVRFEREVQQTCQLTHPNTIEIYDYGRTPEGIFYYVMEHLDGLTVGHLVAMDGPMPPGRVAAVLRQVCGSLQEAHEIGLIHRDIKSQNIMLCERGGNYDVVKVLDFGLAKDVAAPDTFKAAGPDGLAGTPKYIAPERLRDARIADARTDLFSVGAVAFLMVTGHEAFLGSSVQEICEQVLHAPIAHPSECIDRPIPAGLDELIFNCLSRNPNDRPASAAEVIDLLDAIEGLDEWGPGEARQWWHNNTHKIRSVRARRSASWQAGTGGATDPTPPLTGSSLGGV